MLTKINTEPEDPHRLLPERAGWRRLEDQGHAGLSAWVGGGGRGYTRGGERGWSSQLEVEQNGRAEHSPSVLRLRSANHRLTSGARLGSCLLPSISRPMSSEALKACPDAGGLQMSYVKGRLNSENNNERPSLAPVTEKSKLKQPFLRRLRDSALVRAGARGVCKFC
jgi:hypothetical protein